MLLAIDIGNTHTVIGVYAGDSLRAMWRIATNRKAAADELRIVFSTLFSLESLDLSQVDRTNILSSWKRQSFGSIKRFSTCQ